MAYLFLSWGLSGEISQFAVNCYYLKLINVTDTSYS